MLEGGRAYAGGRERVLCWSEGESHAEGQERGGKVSYSGGSPCWMEREGGKILEPMLKREGGSHAGEKEGESQCLRRMLGGACAEREGERGGGDRGWVPC